MKSQQTIFQVLKSDHREVNAMLKELCKMTTPTEKRKKLFEKMKTELLAHAYAEDEVFYNTLVPGIKKPHLIFEAKEEHHLVEFLMAELQSPELSPEEWNAKIIVLKELVEHHVEDEEGDVFEQAEKLLDKESSKEIAQQMLERKQELIEAGIDVEEESTHHRMVSNA